MKKLLLLAFFFAFAGFLAKAQVPDRTGWWKFDDAADMLKAETGSPLVLTGTQVSIPGPKPGNLATEIGLGSYLTLTHGIAANLGGTMVNEYSVQIDFSVPEAGLWHSFIQTTPANDDDADLFTKTNNTIGTSATGYSTNAISADTWYRMIISVKNGEFFKVYLNGELWLDGTSQAIDDRWALASTLLLFADNDGDDATINCSEVAIWDVALNAAQVTELGNASVETMPNRVGWWKFDDEADMLKAETGSPLVLTGSQLSVPGPVEGNLATQVGVGSYLTMTHGIAANLGGSMVNEYSLQIDFSVPKTGIWHSFFQTTVANDDDADLFTKTDNTIGAGATGYSTNTISADTWYRMIISVKNGESFKIYLNGGLWLDGTVQDVDGRWSLDNVLLLFADNDGDDGVINCSEAAIWDKALTAAQALQLGTPAGNVLVGSVEVTGEAGATTIQTEGGTLQMVATILPADATDKSVNWEITAGADKATISADGLLTAIKNGTVTVKATSNDGGNISGSMDVIISNQPVILVTSIEISGEGGASTIETQGGTLQMIATILPANATDQTVTWTVTPGTGDASIDQNGLLTALEDGLVGVKATANDGSAVFGGTVIEISNQTVIRPRVGLWKFDDPSDLLKATIGSPLTLSGSQTSVTGPVTGNLATEVPLGSYLTLTHGIPANGGGSLVNEWSLQIDFSVPQIDTWYAFFQTLDGDADLFVAKTEALDIGRVPNSIGCGSTLYSENTISANVWYRMIVSVKNGEFFRIYVNGELWLDAATQPIDGRYGLSPTLGLFQDDDGDDGTILCSEAAIWDVALTEGEAAGLGNATNTTSGITTRDASSMDLGQNYPNPFSGTTTFDYKVNTAGKVSFVVYNAIGQAIKEINKGKQPAGSYQLELNASQLNNGIYYLQMKNNNQVINRRMIVSK